MYKKTIRILCIGRKFGGYCIGGIDVETGKWVRCVKERTGQKPFFQPELDTLLPGDGKVNFLDVIEMTFIEKAPLRYQPENEIVDLNTPWIKKSSYTSATVAELDDLVNIGKNQLMDDTVQWLQEYEKKDPEDNHSSVPPEFFINKQAKNSMELIKLTQQNKTKLLYFKVPRWKGSEVKMEWKPRLEFYYRDCRHNISITDLKFPPLQSKPNSLPLPYSVGVAYTSIGFTPKFKKPGSDEGERHWKLIGGMTCELNQPERWNI